MRLSAPAAVSLISETLELEFDVGGFGMPIIMIDVIMVVKFHYGLISCKKSFPSSLAIAAIFPAYMYSKWVCKQIITINIRFLLAKCRLFDIMQAYYFL